MNEEQNAAMIGRTISGVTIAWNRGDCYDFETPNPEIITIEDVAYALAFTERWRGQTWYRGDRVFYSVAQHCVIGAEEMLAAGHSEADALGFLVHEDDEVVMPNLAGPVKSAIAGWREMAAKQGSAISARFGWSIPDKTLCKAWDLRMLVTEKRDILPGFGNDTFQNSEHGPVPEDEYAAFDRLIRPYDHPVEGALRWMHLYEKLGGRS